ncbi:hypothetical protein FRC12_001608 [Ceratobasidium sp. 428]|nr:hypothetical protein FRC12_001608 [Ceratobasidium sp. 428]
MKDIGHTSEHINNLLSVRLQRRLSPALRTGPGPNRPEVNSGQRPNPTERRPQQQSQQQRRTPDSGPPRTSFSRPRNTGPGMRGPGRQGGGGKSTSSPRFPRRPSRSMTPRSRDVVEEPEEPVPPAPIPSRVYDMTSLPILTSPTQPLEPINRPSDVVQHVRETVGGDYSKWMSKEDTAAAGKDDVPSIARAKLALAFNSSISPQDRKRLLDKAETLLNRGKTVSVPVTSQ